MVCLLWVSLVRSVLGWPGWLVAFFVIGRSAGGLVGLLAGCLAGRWFMFFFPILFGLFVGGWFGFVPFVRCLIVWGGWLVD